MNEILPLVEEAIGSENVRTLAVLVVGTLAGIVTVVAVLKRVRELVQKARSAALARGLLAQAVPEELVPPWERESYKELEGRFRESLDRLRGSRLGGGGERALYTLPFHVMMGPPGAGKTTLIRGSGLDFLQGSENIEAIPGIGGTRDCNWWFTNDGIILDTAGRYTSEDADHEEWLAFLRLLRQHREKKPIDGVIIAVSVEFLMSEGRDVGAVADFARDLRRRVDELCEKLDVIPPLYLLVTKCDLLPGFRESFAEMGEREREQIWGFTLSIQSNEPLVEVVAREYGALLERIEARALWRVDLEQSRPRRQTNQLALLSSLQELAKHVSSLVEGLMRPDRYRHEPLLRGVYLTSGMQEGQPLAHLRQRTGPWASEAEEGRAPARAITFFVKKLFLDVIFPDHDLARRTDLEIRRERFSRAAVMGSAGAMLVSSYLAVSGALVGNHAVVARASEAVTPLRGVADGSRALDAVAVRELAHLVALVTTLAEHGAQGTPLRFRVFGFDRGQEIAEPLSRFVAMVLRVVIFEPAFAADVEALQGIASRGAGEAPLTAAEAQAAYRGLRRHLLVTRRPDEFGRPTRSASDVPSLGEHVREIEGYVVGFWRSRIRSLPAADLRKVARALAEGMAAGAGFFLRDEELVGSVRAQLSPYYPESRCDLVQLEAMIEADDVDLADLTGGDPFPLRAGGDGKVPGFFTRAAWLQARDLARRPGSLCADGDWVLGRARAGSGSQAGRIDALMSEYVHAYAQRWRSYVESISIDFGRDCEHVALALDGLTTANNAMSRLLQGLRGHLYLGDRDSDEMATGRISSVPWWQRVLEEAGAVAPTSGTSSAVPTASERSDRWISREFHGLDLFCPEPGSTEDAAPCDELRSAWSKLSSLPITPDRGDDEGAVTVIRETKREVQGVLAKIDARWQPWLFRFTGGVSDQVDGCVTGCAIDTLCQAWAEQVEARWEQATPRKYPFSRYALTDASPDDLRALFDTSDGALWHFYESRLSALVSRDGAGGFRRDGRVGAINSSALAGSLTRTLEDADRVAQALLTEQVVEVMVYPVEHPDFFVERTTLRAGDLTFSFRNARHRPQQLPWPLVGEGGVRLSVSGRRTRGSSAIDSGSANGERLDQTLHYPGPWGLLRLIDDSKVEILAGGERIVLTKTLHDLMGAKVVIELGLGQKVAAIFERSRRRGDPLAMVRRLESPPPLLSARSSCAPQAGEAGR